jgi:uncharacterized protein (UPF0276 family)
MRNFTYEPISGVGVGLRACHYQHILTHRPQLPWFEILSDNYLVAGGPALNYLLAIREHYPMVMHGVGMSLGGSDPLDKTYLQKLKNLIKQVQPVWVSDHLCWTAHQQQHMHDLLPLPQLESVVQHVATRIQQVQDYLGQRILIENVSSYLTYQSSEMPEWAFLNAVAAKADCDILLDINNVYVNSVNHQFAPEVFLQQVDASRVKQIHLAGHKDHGDYLFDDHGSAVQAPVWSLYQTALKQIGAVPTLIEWDNNLPEFATLQQQARQANQYLQAVMQEEVTAC